ncbi:MAG: peptide chain release factor aRF-1 [Candidatus Micrarchaeota archaeon]
MAGEKEYELKKTVRSLKQFSGSGTQLISVFIPAGYPIHETAGKLREELSQASNIKSKQTRTNVTDALEKILNYMKMFRQTPENGLAVFAGNVSDNPAKTDIRLFSLEPPQKLNVSIYRCDSRFFLEPLERMLEAKDVYGVIAMDGREATLAIVRGTEIQVVKKLISHAHAKVRKGGQSARRYERLIEESIEKYYKRVGEAVDEHFLGRIKGMVVGGPGPTKEFFVKMSPFNYQIKVLGVVDTGYTDEYGIREALSKAESILETQGAVKERALVERFIKEVVGGGLATYGLREVMGAVESRQAATVLVSEGLQFNMVEWKCSSCGETLSKPMREEPKPVRCPKCGAEMEVTGIVPLIDYLIENAEEKGIKIEVVSTNTVEGNQFLQGFGGIGAFLKYRTTY